MGALLFLPIFFAMFVVLFAGVHFVNDRIKAHERKMGK